MRTTCLLTLILTLNASTIFADNIAHNLTSGRELAADILNRNSDDSKVEKDFKQIEGENTARRTLEISSTQGSLAKEGERFGQGQLDKHESYNPYNLEAENVVNNYEQIKETGMFKDAQEHARSIMLKKPFKVDEVEGKLADARGVNLDVALSRYWKKFNDGKKRQENLPDLMVFVSFSMPERSLIELAEQVKRSGGQLVFRGMVKNSMQVTAQAMLGLNSHGVKAIIHPKLFERFEVKHVPTFVLLNSKESNCTYGNCTPLHDRISGNISLNYVLEEFASSGDHKELANTLLVRARGNQ